MIESQIGLTTARRDTELVVPGAWKPETAVEAAKAAAMT